MVPSKFNSRPVLSPPRRRFSRQLARQLAVSWLLLAGVLTPALLSGPAFAQGDIPEVVLELLDRASRAQERGRASDSEAAYREAIELAPQVVGSYAGLGALLFQQGQKKEALEVFNAGLRQVPDDRGLRYNAAVLSLDLDQPQEALGHVERALESHPRDAELYLFQGAVLRRLERGAEALASLQRAAELAPREPRVLYALGNAYHEQGRLDDAVTAYQRAIDRDENFLRAHYNLGAVLVELGRYDEAERAYRVALAPIDQALAAGENVDPVHARAYRNLGASHFQRRQWRDAVTAYSKAVRLDPTDASGQYHLGFAYYELGDDDAAASTYRRALDLDPALPLAYLHLARIARRQEQPDEAVRQARAGLSYLQGDDRVSAYRLLAEVHAAQGQSGEAEPAWREVLAARPDDLPALLALGRQLRLDGRLQEARPLIEHAFELAPAEPAAALELASLARLQADPRAEEAVYRRVLQGAGSAAARPEFLPVRLNLVLVLLQQERGAEARTQLAGLLPSLDSSTGPSLDSSTGTSQASTRHALITIYALLLARDGELEPARQQLAQLLDEGADYQPTVLASAVLDALSGETERATRKLEELQRRVSGSRSAPDSASQDLVSLGAANLGQLLWLSGPSGPSGPAAGREAPARSVLEAAVERFPRWPGPRLALAEVLARAGDLGPAVAQLQAMSSACEETSVENPVAPRGAGSERVQLLLSMSTDARAQLCTRRSQVLGVVRTAQALAALSNGGSTSVSQAGQLADEALRLPLSRTDEARAHFVRGTARLVAGVDARPDLNAAVGGQLDATLLPVALNNLGIALQRSGDPDAAGRRFEAARRAAPALAAATLNLGIVREQSGDSAAALELYRAYVSSGGRRGEVTGWIETLQRFLP